MLGARLYLSSLVECAGVCIVYILFCLVLGCDRGVVVAVVASGTRELGLRCCFLCLGAVSLGAGFSVA